MSEGPAPLGRLVAELSRLPGIGQRSAQRLAFHLLRADDGEAEALAGAIRELIAKAWLVELILNAPLAEADRLPLSWATSELPVLIGDILRAVAEGSPPWLAEEELARAARLAELREGAVSPSRLNRELAALQSTLLG